MLRRVETTPMNLQKGANVSTGENSAVQDSILSFKNGEEAVKDVSDEKVVEWAMNQSDKTPKQKTEEFKQNVMNKLNFSNSNRSNVEHYLNKLITVMQELNGVRKNNLKPNEADLEKFEAILKQKQMLLNDYVDFIDSNLSVVQDSRTGLLKISIDGELLDVPERKVKLGVETEDGMEPEPQIID